MRFNINITGEFDNIKGLRVAQRYYIDIRCGACNTLHPKTIFIAEENWRTMKIRELARREETFNVVVQCRNCDNMMGIVILEPENQFEFEEDFYLSPVINDKCHVSTILSDRAVVTNVDGLILDAVSKQEEIFRNCSFDKRTLAEDDNKGRTIDILKFDIEVEQVQ
ncbi:uncharacterized protein VICG_02062 [Vittaforma corneae ATCC 50505]|uniref:Uncharacterized protein n=1 Tax=Vittaforma corneae (strain ATCC 50505) TaxID=993615 RepID=L2GKU7_VITCO|nr:uncharacterized protein VICG_02062 [Vittaforma corneae ATCC 50505]ELA40922.1 hypothetical protein VICG_02062 [Vittaforma corneae ATCC 50505]